MVGSEELRRAEESLSQAYALARATGYRTGSPQMRTLQLSEHTYQDARERHDQQVLEHTGQTRAPAASRDGHPDPARRRSHEDQEGDVEGPWTCCTSCA